MNSKLKKLCITGLLAAMVTVVTMFVMFPVGTAGAYVNAGDAIIYVAAYLVGGWWGAAAAGIGAALADILRGVAFYAPATLIIKGTMALIASFIMTRKLKGSMFVAPVVAGLVVPVGYFLYEWAITSFEGAFAGITFNLIQYAGCLVIGIVLLIIASRVKNSITKEK